MSSIWVQGWARRASREELEQVLALLLEVHAPLPLEHALRCIGGSTLPLLHPRIFELTRHEDQDVRYWAGRVLSKHSLPGVRDCGLEALARGDLLVALEILTRSTQVDDREPLIAALRPSEDPEEEHGICSGVLDILEHCPEVRDPRLALHVYERTPCMQCREKGVCLLVRSQEASQWLLEECTYDADKGIREVAERARATHPPPPGLGHRGSSGSIRGMPVISVFFGIVIRMFYREHGVAHFHAEHQGQQATFTFDGKLLAGEIRSRTALRLIEEWAKAHRPALESNWGRMKAGAPLERIEPLD
jgi:hypothetical protein